MILLLTNKWDVSTDFIVRALKNRGADYIRINTEDLPFEHCTALFPESKYYLVNDEELFSNLKSVLLRRPARPFEIGGYLKEYDMQVVDYCSEQWHSMLEGLLCIDGILWINNPFTSNRMENKIIQLATAKSFGLKIPRTCITSNREMAKEFMNSLGDDAIVKNLCSSIIEYPEKDYFIFSNVLTDIEEFERKEIEIAPVIYQEYFRDKIDYRVTVVGDKVFSVKIVTMNGDGLDLDWRTYKENIQFIPCDIPVETRDICVKYLSSSGLAFGAFDFVETREGFYFLEINPNGEWGWLQKNAGLPIGDTIAEYLIKGMEE